MEGVVEIERCEQQLREAMLRSDVAQLDLLLSDTLIFINQDGARLTKADDIAAHRTGLLTITALSEKGERIIQSFGDTATVCLTTEVAGEYALQKFVGTFAYSRVWHHKDGRWQVVLAHCSAVNLAD
ncbi:nuclear transport factor 2 family protein [Agrobacterium sp. FDAARGOS_525]|uniref:nuclear transport factor 2 family protein n=1 Tax=Agrobacterium sp. FDAARGOS_525 TaxID=2420311 RepID=UPI000F680A04|nr:nuclear transport factor 2 family protein [Agrobacterium sp. FDAARGOS_525]RSC37146.1 nuclear transport factor 2 family protein [Agrobacterium sp. FDAARGOS_525]